MEILNIEWHTCQLILKALNRTQTKHAAVDKLGISERSLYRLIATYDIQYDKKKDAYSANKIPQYRIMISKDEYTKNKKPAGVH